MIRIQIHDQSVVRCLLLEKHIDSFLMCECDRSKPCESQLLHETNIDKANVNLHYLR